jgi:hypothetical protein
MGKSYIHDKTFLKFKNTVHKKNNIILLELPNHISKNEQKKNKLPFFCKLLTKF